MLGHKRHILSVCSTPIAKKWRVEWVVVRAAAGSGVRSNKSRSLPPTSRKLGQLRRRQEQKISFGEWQGLKRVKE